MIFNQTGAGSTGGIKLASIEIVTAPAKTAYKAGESFDPAGMVVRATYSNGATLIVDSYTVSPDVLAASDTAVTVTYTEGGVSKSAAQAVSVTKIAVAVPTWNETLTYDGTTQTPTFSNDPGDAIAAKSGDLDGVNAGDYATTFTLLRPDLYEWAASFSGAVAWSIGKAAPALSAAPASVTLDKDNPTATSTITTDSPGTLSASSGDTSVATAVLAGSTVTISSVGETSGSTAITIAQTETANYIAATVTIAVKAQFVSIYGVTWDGTSTTKLTRTDAAADFADPVPYVAGATTYGSPFDGLYPWSDMTRVTDSEAGEMVKIPKFWYKLTKNGNAISIQISGSAQDGYSVCPACMDRGDGAGERDYVLVGRYHCAASDYKSRTGEKPKAGVAQTNFRNAIHNLGSTVYMMDFATRFTLWLLYIVEFADWNSQATIGKGCGNNSTVENMGYTDSMPYHTGTTLSSRGTYGLGTQYRYIEGLWGNVFDRLTGCYNTSSGFAVQIDPSKFAESSGGTLVGTPTSGYISAWSIVSAAGFPMLLASGDSGSATTYVCDSWNFVASAPVILAGGYYSQSGNCGMFRWSCVSTSSTSAYCGSRVLKLPT